MGKMSREEFVLKAIKTLRDPNRSRGIHSRFSGFNEAFRAYFGEDPVPTTLEMKAKGLIEVRPAKGGVMLYLKGEAPAPVGEAALDKILQE
ncbi:MAG: hypothetical protein QW212_00620 [Nitrososphaerales archaeon]